MLGLDRAVPAVASPIGRRRKKRDEIIAYLRAREQVTSVYLETWRQVTVRRIPNGRSARWSTASTAATRNTPAGSRSMRRLIWSGTVTDAPAQS